MSEKKVKVTRYDLDKLSSLEFWFPKVKDIGVPVPKTTIVKLSKRELKHLHEENLPDSVVKKVAKAAKRYGYPFFLRTDLASGKHQWEKSCFVKNPDTLANHVHEVIMFNLLADFMGIPFNSLVVREYIELESSFTAFWGKMPVAKERRYFIRKGEVECRHEYWVEGAIRQGMQHSKIPESEWLQELKELNTQTKEEIELLTEYARKIGKELHGYWSVDFAKSKEGTWYFIDCGRGEISYHVPDCPKNVWG